MGLRKATGGNLFSLNNRRRLWELMRDDRYSHPALYDLDRKLAHYLPERNLTFVELGANDGFTQSNTYYFERFRGWRGVLIEPVPELYERAKRRRRRAKVFNAACVPFDYQGSTVHMTYCNLMSVVQGALHSSAQELEHIRVGSEIQQIRTYELDVPARTLTSILDEALVRQIDLLSLDVEGFELDVLRGLDFDRYAPRFMIIEARFKDEINAFLVDRYEVVEQLSVHDYLYCRRQVELQRT